MKTQRPNEIVIEFKKIQAIRRQAQATFRDCHDCGRAAYFVELGTAARILETSYNALWNFIVSTSTHRDTVTGYETNICLQSLLEITHRRKNGDVIRLIDALANAE